ncbi:MAG: flagellar basal-body rod modification protein FlgD, partial [Myxococcota bacterium]
MNAIPSTPQAPFDPTATSANARVDDGALGKDDFLNLLVAQLGNQDPLSPTDPTDFVSQLSQFTSLEQLIGLREGLDLLAITQTAGTSAEMVSF